MYGLKSIPSQMLRNQNTENCWETHPYMPSEERGTWEGSQKKRINYELGKNLEIKETLKSKYAHKYVRGGRMAHYMQKLPIRWPHGERVTWKRRSLVRSTFRYLCCYFHFTRPCASDVFNKLLIRDTTAAGAEDFKSQKRCFDVKLSLCFLTFALAFRFSCVYILV